MVKTTQIYCYLTYKMQQIETMQDLHSQNQKEMYTQIHRPQQDDAKDGQESNPDQEKMQELQKALDEIRPRIKSDNQEALMRLYQKRLEEDEIMDIQDFIKKHHNWVNVKQKNHGLPHGYSLKYKNSILYIHKGQKLVYFLRIKDLTETIYGGLQQLEDLAIRGQEDKKATKICESYHPDNLENGLAYCRSWEGQIQTLLYHIVKLPKENLKEFLPAFGKIIDKDTINDILLNNLVDNGQLYPCPDRYHKEGNMEKIYPMLKRSITRIIFNNINRCLAQNLINDLERQSTFVQKGNRSHSCQKDCPLIKEEITKLVKNNNHNNDNNVYFGRHKHTKNWWKNNRQNMMEYAYQEIWSLVKSKKIDMAVSQAQHQVIVKDKVKSDDKFDESNNDT